MSEIASCTDFSRAMAALLRQNCNLLQANQGRFTSLIIRYWLLALGTGAGLVALSDQSLLWTRQAARW